MSKLCVGPKFITVFKELLKLTLLIYLVHLTYKYSQQWFNDHFQIATTISKSHLEHLSHKRPLCKNYLSTTATIFWSQGWSLFTGLTVCKTSLELWYIQSLSPFCACHFLYLGISVWRTPNKQTRTASLICFLYKVSQLKKGLKQGIYRTTLTLKN